MTPLKQPTIEELRGIAYDEIVKIRDGQTTPATVNAVVNSIRAILSTVKLQMEYAKQTGKTPDIPLLAPLNDGRPPA